MFAHECCHFAGATGEMVDLLAKKMIEERKIRFDRAKELATELSKEKKR